MKPKAKSIVFTADQVRATLAGCMTQVRQPVRPTPGEQSTWLTQDMINAVLGGDMVNGGWRMRHPKAGTVFDGVLVAHDSPLGWIRCPYGGPGERLLVKETMRRVQVPGGAWTYAADGFPVFLARDDSRVKDMLAWAHHKEGDVCAANHMPPWASRLELEVTAVRVERLHDITRSDALAEGVPDHMTESPYHMIGAPEPGCEEIGAFGYRWAKRYGAASWFANPWTWVLGLRVIAGGAK